VTWTEFSQLITAVGVLTSAVLSWRNGRKLDEVHKSTNGLSERAEALAKKLGVEEGKAEEKKNPS
jgi:hypothetical protein